MATLEKIRSRQGLLFTVIIVALFLFIISSAGNLTGCSRSDKMMKAGNVSVSYQEFQDYKQQQSNRQGVDQDSLTQAALYDILTRNLAKQEYERAGIRVTDSQISSIMNGETLNPMAYQFVGFLAQALQLPSADASMVLNAIYHPENYGLAPEQLAQIANYLGYQSLDQAWAAFEGQLEQSLQAQAYSALLNGLFTYNKLDAESLFNDNFNTVSVSYVATPLNSIQDEIEVTDAELRAKWEELKPFFRVNEETRLVDYVVVEITPSADDYAAAEAEVESNAQILRENPGQQGLNLISRMDRQPVVITKNEISRDPVLRMIPDSLLTKDGVYQYPRQRNVYRIAKVMDVTNRIDSVNLSIYVAASAEEADSVLNLINSGEQTFAGLAAANPQMAADSIWNRLVGATEDVVATYNTHLAAFDARAARTPYIFVDTIPQGAQDFYRIVKINSHRAPVEVVDIENLTITVDPSSATETQLKTDLTNFIAANNNGELFSQNADSLYNLMSTVVTASTPHLGGRAFPATDGGLENSRDMIKWAMKAKAGQVSPIFQETNYYAVEALKAIYDDDYIPYTDESIKETLTQLVIADKKAQMLNEQFAGKSNSLEGYAELMNSQVQEIPNFSIASPNFGIMRGGEHLYNVLGRVAGAQAGVINGPIQESNNVVVFMVTPNEAQTREFDEMRDGDQFTRTFRFNLNDPTVFRQILLGNKKVENKSLDFENLDQD